MQKFSYLVLVVLLALGVSAQAQERYISVQGQGQVEVMPDFVKMKLYVRAQESNAMAAKQKVDDAMKAVLALSKQFSIATDNIQAADLTRQPYYEWQQNQRILKGEEVSRTVQLTFTDLDKYADFLQGLITVDNVQILNHELGFNSTQSLNEKAMELALLNAKNKAANMAAVLNNRLGRVLSIDEQGVNHAMPMMSMRMSSEADSSAPAPQIIQKQKVSAQVGVRFELK